MSSTVELPNGEFVPVEVVQNLRIALSSSAAAVHELAAKAQNPAHCIVPADYCRPLTKLGLLLADGSVCPDVAKVIVACMVDHGPAVTWHPPVGSPPPKTAD